jgi:hypothetical protein
MNDTPISRGDREIEPVREPTPIPPPTRVWTNDAMAVIRRGQLPGGTDDRWLAFMEGDTLFLHRSWTGRGIYEATFVPWRGGHVIASAVVAGDLDHYRRGSDAVEQDRLEALVSMMLEADE